MTTFGDQVKQFGGVPVSSVNYAGWWGNDVWFVDDINGNDGNTGKSPTAAKKTIQAVINIAGPQDTIFLRPRDISTGRYHEHGYYTGTLNIPATNYSLSIIGTGNGARGVGANIQCAIEADSAATAATITVKAPCFNIENVMVKQINEATTAGAINAVSTFGTQQAWGLTVSNCMFKDFQSAGSGLATIHIDTAHWATIQHCIFREADMAINLLSTEAAIRGAVIRDCDFWGNAADVSNDIRVGDCKNLLIDKCKFLHALPTGAAPLIYINFVGAAAVGIISNCMFSTTDADEANAVNLAGSVIMANCYGTDYLT